MTDVAWIEHLFVLAFAVGYPIVGFLSYRRFQARVAGGEAFDRATLYIGTIIPHWLLLVMAGLIWWWSGRDWALLGVAFDADLGMGIGALAIFGLVVALLVFVARVRTGKTSPARVGNLGEIEAILPQSRKELRLFYALSVTAGVVEEVLWRGFLIYYLQLFMPLWVAGVVSALAFGVAHAYQGLKKVSVIVLVGAVFTWLYLSTESLLLPIVLHIAIDGLQGRLAFEVLTTKPRRIDL